MANKKTDADPLIIWESFLRTAARLIQVFDDEMVESAGFPLSWYDVLAMLRLAKGGRLRMQALAESVVFSPSGLTRLIDRMEREGMVTRIRDKADRRGYFVGLSPKGWKTVAKARAQHHRGIAQYFTQHLTSDELRCLDQALSKVRTALPPRRLHTK